MQLAADWLTLVPAAGATCALSGLLAAIDLAEGSTAFPVLIFTAEGPPNCPGPSETIAGVAAANGGPVPIYPVVLSSDTSTNSFMQVLAQVSQFVIGSTPFLRGDVNGDAVINIADPIFILQAGFGLSCDPFCRDAGDGNGDGIFEPISDAVTVLGTLFVANYPPLPAPYPQCGLETFPNTLTCFTSTCP